MAVNDIYLSFVKHTSAISVPKFVLCGPNMSWNKQGAGRELLLCQPRRQFPYRRLTVDLSLHGPTCVSARGTAPGSWAMGADLYVRPGRPSLFMHHRGRPVVPRFMAVA